MDKKYLKHALWVARSRLGFTFPNPAVGAVIVNSNGLVSSGFHYRAGDAHAEVIAIRKIKIKCIESAVMYVTLEPCSHYGKTPPCTKAIIDSGIKKVIFGFKDPNPLVHNKSSDILRQNGVECKFIQVDEIDDFYKYYQYWVLNKKSWLSVKIAVDKNGVYSGHNGPVSITNECANYWTHEHRLKHDALLTTAKTIRSDHPTFSVRYRGEVVYKPIIIITKSVNIDFAEKLFKQNRKVIIIYTDKDVNLNKFNVDNLDVEFFLINYCISSSDFWVRVVALTARLGYHSIWAELGGFSLNNLLKSNVVCCYYKIVNIFDNFEGIKLYDDFERLKSISCKKLFLDNNELIIYNFLKNLPKG